MSVNSLSIVNESNFLSLNNEVELNVNGFLKSGNLKNALSLISELSKNPGLIPVFKDSFSKELKDISLRNGVKKVIEIVSIMKNTTVGYGISDLSKNELFDLNNPSILFGLMLSESIKTLNNTARRDVLEKYFHYINENDIISLIQNLEEIDSDGTLFKPFVKELVTFIFRNVEDNISIKEKPDAVVQSQSNFKFLPNGLGDEYDYGSKIDSAGDTGFDLESYVLGYDDVVDDEWGIIHAKNYKESTDLVSEIVSLGDDAIVLSQVEELFDNVDSESHFYFILNYLKQNYFSIYKNIISDIRNFSINSNHGEWSLKVLTTDSSRLLHQRVNELLDLPPKEIEDNVITTLGLDKSRKEKIKGILKISSDNNEKFNVEKESNDLNFGDVLLDDDNL